ncbi:inositol 1,4,5-trisphosphate receptor-interacting protein [Centropristis striata]|uniref:inositol 1,4,5-trisphosphate receptor-interacting protein n=1 Tax=Centropristis striata TaxID=184440 RepID=UPI0027DF3325|nr:inositol 1,4,5-trisphosphate receptor-interacting protein [Centropristis striata]
MPDIVLRVFVVTLGLLTFPRDDPRVKEWDDVTTVGMQKHEEKLLRGEEELDHDLAPVRQEITYTESGVKNIQSDQHVVEEATVSKQDPEEDVDDQDSPEGGHFMENSKSEPEQKGNLDKESEDFQADGSLTDSSRPQETAEEKEVFTSEDEESPPSHLHTVTSEEEASEKALADWEQDYLWYMWNTLSIISMIRFFRKYLGKSSQKTQEETRTCTAAGAPLPDSSTLQRFHSKCIQVSSDKKWKEFLEGFADGLVEAMRTVCRRNGGMVIEDFQIVDVFDIIVPLAPPDPFSFQCHNYQASELLSEVCGQIKLVENKKIPNGCPCQSPNSDDMVCLLHCETEKVKTKITDVRDSLLCTKNSPFLSKSHVTRWFQSTVKQAWEQISHKYEFELNMRYIGAPGALTVRFRSGKKISFRMNPVVRVNTDAHFFITPCSTNNSDTFWTLSLASYEDHLLECISKRLPANSCHSQTLDVALFLHKRQTALSGSSALEDCHFKTALMHLLLTKEPSQWKPSHVACRLRDLLAFMERSLKKRLLHHALIGNPLSQRVIELPAEFTQAKSMNLFHPLLVDDCLYTNAVMHFQEMLRNAHMLIQDYVNQCQLFH